MTTKAKATKAVNLTKAAAPATETKYDFTNYPTVSSKIRYLSGEGKSRSEISKILTAELGYLVRYQHVRNVLTQPLKRPTE